MEGEMTNIITGSKAPGFSLKGLDGKDYALGKLSGGGPVVATFFKISCPVCQFTFPFLERIFQRYGGEGISFLGISQDDARSTKEFAEKYGVSFPFVTDEKNYPVSNAYGLTNVPTILLIEPDGTVKVSSTGFVKTDLETMANELAGRRKIKPEALFKPDEKVPSFQPG
jgi:peroxiredoxin